MLIYHIYQTFFVVSLCSHSKSSFLDSYSYAVLPVSWKYILNACMRYFASILRMETNFQLVGSHFQLHSLYLYSPIRLCESLLWKTIIHRIGRNAEKNEQRNNNNVNNKDVN